MRYIASQRTHVTHKQNQLQIVVNNHSNTFPEMNQDKKKKKQQQAMHIQMTELNTQINK